MPKSEFDFEDLGLRILAGALYLVIFGMLVAATAALVKLTLLIIQM